MTPKLKRVILNTEVISKKAKLSENDTEKDKATPRTIFYYYYYFLIFVIDFNNYNISLIKLIV